MQRVTVKRYDYERDKWRLVGVMTLEKALNYVGEADLQSLLIGLDVFVPQQDTIFHVQPVL